MESKTGGFWWTKSKKPQNSQAKISKNLYEESNIAVSTNSLVDLFEKEAESLKEKGECSVNIDVGSIIEEINRVAAQSPLGPYDRKLGERSVDELMKEAERIYKESSKSFEQLSQCSKTSQNISEISSNISTPTPKSISPLPLDSPLKVDKDSDEYSEDFSESSKIERTPSPDPKIEPNKENKIEQQSDSLIKNDIISEATQEQVRNQSDMNLNSQKYEKYDDFVVKKQELEIKQMQAKDNLIKALEEDNLHLKKDIQQLKNDLARTSEVLKNTKESSRTNITAELEKALDTLKDTKEINTGLQLQLDALTHTNNLLKTSHDDLFNQNKNLEKKLNDMDVTMSKFKQELYNAQRHRDKLIETELSLNKLLDVEKMQTKSLKIQSENDAKLIKDLNRQIKEMERIIARKHPDSVSALIMAAKNDATDSNLTARKVLEDRIKTLEQEAAAKDKESSTIYQDIQEKFNQMKAKYENHIEDLELHVSDLKTQLKSRTLKEDLFDIYTQTVDLPEKETTSISVQTDTFKDVKSATKIIAVKTNPKLNELQTKSETHLMATIRGLQNEISLKERTMTKMQREMDELKKTNRRLQKEREGSLKNISERKEFRSYPEKLAAKLITPTDSTMSSKEDLVNDKVEFDKIKEQLQRIETEYQNLKKKRIHDLNALQEAHEREITQYLQSINPLREQLELQQLTIETLQGQLAAVKEELVIVTVERDHLNKKMSSNGHFEGLLPVRNGNEGEDISILKNQIQVLEKRYEEREHRLRAIVTSLAQKNVTNGNCDQCAERQQQLINYKIELDQLLATLRALQ